MEEASTSSGRCNVASNAPQQQISSQGLQQAQQPTQIKQPTQTFVSAPSVNSGPETDPPQEGGHVSSFSDFYSIDWTPKEFYVKFRQQLNGYQVAANFEVSLVSTFPDSRLFWSEEHAPAVRLIVAKQFESG